MKRLKLKYTVGHDILMGATRFRFELTEKEKATLESNGLKVIAVDGVDKTGKSTLINQVLKVRKNISQTGYSISFHGGNHHFRYYGGDEFITLGRFIVIKRYDKASANICFVKSGIHSRVIQATARAMVDKEFLEAIKDKKYKSNLSRLNGAEKWNDKIRGYINTHLFHQEMFDLFYADYISMLKKLVKIIEKHNIQTLVLDRSWVSNYAYNKYQFFKEITEDDIIDKILNDGCYKLKIDYLFLAEIDRLISLNNIGKYNKYDFYESEGYKKYYQVINNTIARIGMSRANKEHSCNKEICHFVGLGFDTVSYKENSLLVYAHQLREFDMIIEGVRQNYDHEIKTELHNNEYYDVIKNDFFSYV